MCIDDGANTYARGRCYFRVTYYDKKCVYPKLETVVYLGTSAELQDKLNTEEGFLYFQDAESYAAHGLLNSQDHKIDRDEIIITETTIKIAKTVILDFEGMARELMRWNKGR